DTMSLQHAENGAVDVDTLMARIRRAVGNPAAPADPAPADPPAADPLLEQAEFNRMVAESLGAIAAGLTADEPNARLPDLDGKMTWAADELDRQAQAVAGPVRRA